MKLDAYTVVFLRRPAGAPQMPDAELDALQQRHLLFWAELRKAGHVLVNGPFTGQPDESLRGFSVFRTSLDETRRLAEKDPSVLAGRLVPEVFTWLMPHGALGDRPAATIDDA
jgi:hypothetical protein